MPNGLVFECHLNTGRPNHLNARQMDAILFSYVLVWFSNDRSSTKDSLRPKISILNHLKSELQKVCYTNVSGIQMVGIQIPTVLCILKGAVEDNLWCVGLGPSLVLWASFLGPLFFATLFYNRVKKTFVLVRICLKLVSSLFSFCAQVCLKDSFNFPNSPLNTSNFTKLIALIIFKIQ